jgi:hypothetical protein
VIKGKKIANNTNIKSKNGNPNGDNVEVRNLKKYHLFFVFENCEN